MKKISKNWSENVEWIIKKYIEGWNQVKLAAEFTTATNTTIRRVLIKHNIPIRGVGLDRRKLRHNPFVDLTDNSTQYWLGMIAADGHIYKNRFSLSSSKHYHLEQYHDFINVENKHIASYRHAKFVNSICNKVEFTDEASVQTMVSIGITPRKSLTLDIKQPLNWPFVHGVFDGDGWVTLIPKKKGVASRNRCIVSICTGSIAFRDQLLKFFKDENIHCTHRTQKNKGSENVLYIVGISTQSEVEKFYRQLYKYAPKYFIKEKYMRFGAVFGEIL